MALKQYLPAWLATRASRAKTWCYVVRNGLIYRVSPRLLATIRYRAAYGRSPNLDAPEEFDEKLLWLMLNSRDPLRTRCGDKYGLRGYAEEKGLGRLLPRLYGVWDSAEHLREDDLPHAFALKGTHGCKFNLVCPDRDRFDLESVRPLLRKWLAIRYDTRYGESHYRGMKPRILCEEFLDQGQGRALIDYKAYCFGGRVHCFMACTDREPNGNAKYDFYDREWKTWLPYSRSSLGAGRRIAPPEGLPEMVAAAETLSEGMPFVRVDFYGIGPRVILGEMTFTPAGCVDPGHTDEARAVFSKLLRLPPPGRPDPRPPVAPAPAVAVRSRAAGGPAKGEPRGESGREVFRGPQ